MPSKPQEEPVDEPESKPEEGNGVGVELGTKGDVSVTLFTSILDALEKEYGSRVATQTAMQGLIRRIGELGQYYEELDK